MIVIIIPPNRRTIDPYLPTYICITIVPIVGAYASVASLV